MRSTNQCIKSKKKEYNATGEIRMKEFCEPVIYNVRGTKFYVTGEEVETDNNKLKDLIINFLKREGVIEDDAI